MALTKYFVISLLVYLNFDISPSNSAAINPEWNANRSENNEKLSVDSETTITVTTVSNDDDIEKIFETYENEYIKNSNWFNEDKQLNNGEETETNSNNQNHAEFSPKSKSNEEDSAMQNLQPNDSSTNEPTAEDVVESVHNIIDEKLGEKSNRTDRTIVVVVTTNVYSVSNGSEANKRQHTELSCGIKDMIAKETSTDATLDTYNKITTNFFNENVSPINDKSGIIDSSDTDSANGEGDNYTEVNDLVVENNSNISSTENQNIVLTTEATNDKQDHVDEQNIHEEVAEIDIRELPDSVDINSIPLIYYEPEATIVGRNFPDMSSHVNLDDILEFKNVVPNRNEDELHSGILTKSFDEKAREEPDSSLMEAIENIPDTDVRKAFERDIPETRHVPLDINIEDDALKYEPLKDMNEYVIEEIRFDGNHDIEDIRKENENSKTTADDTDDVKGTTMQILETEPSTEKIDEVFESGSVKLQKSLYEDPESETSLVSSEKKEESVTVVNSEVSHLDELLSKPITEEVSADVFSSILEDELIDSAASEESTLMTTTTFDDVLTEVSTDAKHLNENQLNELIETSTTDDEVSSSLRDEVPANGHTDRIFSTADSQELDNKVLQQYTTESSKQPEQQLKIEPLTSVQTERELRHINLEAQRINELAKVIYEKFNVPMFLRRYEDPNTTEHPEPVTKKPRIIPQLDVEDILKHETNIFIDDLLSFDENATLLRDIEFTNERDDFFRDFRLELAKSIQRAENRSQGGDQDDNLIYEKEKNWGDIEIVRVKQRHQRQYILDMTDDFERNVEIRYESLLLDYLEICTNRDQDEVPFTFLILMKRFSLLKNERSVVVSEMKFYVVKLMMSTNFISRQDYGGETIFKLNVFNSSVPSSSFGENESYGSENANLKDVEEEQKSLSMLTNLNQYVDTELPSAIDGYFEKKLNILTTTNRIDLETETLIAIDSTTMRQKDTYDVVSEVVKVDDETTEEHQIIKKPGVRNNGNEFEINPTKVLNVISNELSTTKTHSVESRSFVNHDEPVDPLRTLVEAVELTAEITKTVDNFQSLSDPNSSIHDAVNQVIETRFNVELAENELENANFDKLNSSSSTRYMFVAGGVTLIVLIVLLGLFSVYRFRQFKRRILFVN